MWYNKAGYPRSSPSPLRGNCRLPTLHLPTRFGVQFKLFWCYYAQRRAGRPRSSPPPLRGNCRLRPRNRPAVGWLP
ncbi:MAG: hypothetical protein LBQ66_06965 [Planctomycetaceae bacterium]|nr:hypothetical protein [Planctomycetaceae bacterium]